jgi:hypothetical protein
MTPSEVYELLSETIRKAEDKLKLIECYFDVELPLGNEWTIAWRRSKVEGKNSWRICLAYQDGDFVPLESCKIMDRLDGLKLVPILERAMREKLAENLEKIKAGVEAFRINYLDQ